MPAVLKNAIDVASRPYGQNSWNGKPGAVLSVSIGNISGFWCKSSFTAAAVFRQRSNYSAAEAYIGGASALFDDNGDLSNGSTRKFLTSFMLSFEKWVDANTGK